MRPYQGLLVVLLFFNTSEFENSDNARCDVDRGGAIDRSYVISNLATDHGAARTADLERFTSTRFITGVSHGFVEFDYHGAHQELVRDRITRDDVAWAGALLAALTDRQWTDALRAGGFGSQLSSELIQTIRSRISTAQHVGGERARADRPSSGVM
jgi:hypothetical protein